MRFIRIGRAQLKLFFINIDEKKSNVSAIVHFKEGFCI